MEFDVIQYAKQARSIKKSITVKQIAKLENLVEDGTLDVNLDFFMGDTGLPSVKGSIRGALKLTCQRCMRPITQALDLELGLLLLSPNQDMPDMELNLEPYIYDSTSVTLVDLISDDIVLNLPQIAKHPGQSCDPSILPVVPSADEKPLQEAVADSPASASPSKPFSALKDMIQDF